MGYSEVDEVGHSGGGPSGEDGPHMNRPCDRARECWERIEEDTVGCIF
jgi:hypothetical protein